MSLEKDKTSSPSSLKDALENTILANWAGLMPTSLPGQVHIEYHRLPDSMLDYVRIWSSTLRGHWELICEYQVAPGESNSPVTFANDHHSADLVRMLEFIMQNQGSFTLPAEQSPNGMIQVQAPLGNATIEARRLMNLLVPAGTASATS